MPWAITCWRIRRTRLLESELKLFPLYRQFDFATHIGSVLVIRGHLKTHYRRARKMKLLTIQEVADTMKVSEKTVRRLIKRGDIEAYKLGERGQLRVKECELERYVEAQIVQVKDTGAANKKVTERDE